MKKEHKHKIRVVSWILFCIYLVMMVYFLFFSEQMGRVPRDTYQYNLKPFAEIRRYINYADRLGSFRVMLNLAGNVVCFMPFGFVIPVLANRYRKLYKMVALSFFASLLVETIQLFSKLGSFDVDDILLNTLGGLLGYIAFQIGNHILHIWNRQGKN
ncbi:MAG: VanZ family protein [Lachnospiraceae bacterium]|nr:VanZ family protein [Lachnospiraceae bacterium]